MAQENLSLTQPNFCIAPLIGTFATIDTSNSASQLLIKNSTGITTVSYTLNPSLPQNTTVYYFDYLGPRNLNSLQSGMPFITMESNLVSGVQIKKWHLDLDNTRLNLESNLQVNSSGFDSIVSKSMAINRFYTTLNATSDIGTGFIRLSSVNDTVISGTKMYLGPSSNTSFLGAFEEVTITSVSGTYVTISSSHGIPPFSYFNSGDPVTCVSDIYLFSDVGFSADDTKGALIVLDSNTGNVLRRDNNALYNKVTTANYGIPFSNTVALVKNSQLLYVDINDFSIVRSVRLNVTKPFSNTCLVVSSIALTSSNIFRLQGDKIFRDNDGSYSTIDWSTYNYHEDFVTRYSDCISLSTSTLTLSNQETVLITVVVTDQYGMGISGKTVKFSKEYGDMIGVWGNVNSEATTDINGVGTITYTSGWYNPAFFTSAKEDIKIFAKTDGSSILMGSIYIGAFLILKLNAKFLLDHPSVSGLGVNLITQKINSKASGYDLIQREKRTSTFVLRSLSKFKMPGGHLGFESLPQAPIIKQLRSVNCEMEIIQELAFSGTSKFKQLIDYEGNCAVSQTLVSRHLPVGSNTDTVFIAQFKFLIDAVPVPFSSKNNVNSTIWLRLAPYGFDLDKNTLVFKVREVSYAGDTGFIDFVGTPYLQVFEFDAGGGLVGLEILYTPLEYFHNDAVVYVYLEIYDVALPPNRIEFDYWFAVIPDYKSPYIINELPQRDSINIDITTDITFDIIDNEVGVNITSLEIYINNREKTFIYTPIDGGYRVVFFNDHTFYYGQTIEIAVFVEDSSGQSNPLYDMWKFKLIHSDPPYVDAESFYPATCSRGLPTRTTKVIFNVFDENTGIDVSSIGLIVDNITRIFKVTPIVKRLQ